MVCRIIYLPVCCGYFLRRTGTEFYSLSYIPTFFSDDFYEVFCTEPMLSGQNGAKQLSVVVLSFAFMRSSEKNTVKRPAHLIKTLKWDATVTICDAVLKA